MSLSLSWLLPWDELASYLCCEGKKKVTRIRPAVMSIKTCLWSQQCRLSGPSSTRAWDPDYAVVSRYLHKSETGEVPGALQWCRTTVPSSLLRTWISLDLVTTCFGEILIQLPNKTLVYLQSNKPLSLTRKTPKCFMLGISIEILILVI